jgi:hypothetical protein
MRLLLLAGMITGGLVLAGCGGDQTGPPAPPAPPTTSPSASEPVEDLPLPAATPSKGTVRTLTGTVLRDPDSRCLLLSVREGEGAGAWVLLGTAAGLEDGRTVTVVGAVEPDTATTCQQGPVLRVREVLDAG